MFQSCLSGDPLLLSKEVERSLCGCSKPEGNCSHVTINILIVPLSRRRAEPPGTPPPTLFRIPTRAGVINWLSQTFDPFQTRFREGAPLTSWRGGGTSGELAPLSRTWPSTFSGSISLKAKAKLYDRPGSVEY